MPYIKKGSQTEIGKKVEKLAEKVPAPLSWLIPDPYDPASFIQPIGGFTKQAAVKEVVGKFFDPNISTGSKVFLRGALADLLRVIGKTPKKAIEHIKGFKLDPGYVTSGTYHPRRLQVFPSELERAGTMASSFAHEAGHGATMPMAGKIVARQPMGTLGLSPEQRAMDLYLINKHVTPFEGVAEYIGQHLQKQAGLIPVEYFGHGPEQQVVFEQLSKMPSKNPYFNVYRYLQKVLGE